MMTNFMITNHWHECQVSALINSRATWIMENGVSKLRQSGFEGPSVMSSFVSLCIRTLNRARKTLDFTKSVRFPTSSV